MGLTDGVLFRFASLFRFAAPESGMYMSIAAFQVPSAFPLFPSGSAPISIRFWGRSSHICGFAWSKIITLLFKANVDAFTAHRTDPLKEELG
jgi:hypothetical protein